MNHSKFSITDVETTQETHKTEDHSRSFSDLLEEYDYQRPKRGQLMLGEIVIADEDLVVVDVGVKRDAFVPRSELAQMDDSLREGISRGVQVTVYVTHPNTANGNLLVSIQKGLEEADWDRAEALTDRDETVEVEVVGKNRGGYLAKFGALTGFIPRSHLSKFGRRSKSEESPQEPDDRSGSGLKGETLEVKVIEVDRQRNRLILSEREAYRDQRLRRLEALEPGEILFGKVVKLVDYGVFVDIGEVEGLVHISELDWAWISHPSEVVKVGDDIDIQVKKVDRDKGRISLSRKALLPNPFELFTEQFRVGDVLQGTIANVEDFGAFIQLREGLEGLIPMSELRRELGDTPESSLKPGESVLVRINWMDPDRERISLGLEGVTEEELLPNRTVKD